MAPKHPAEFPTDSEDEPDTWTTDQMVAQARAHREGEEYPTPERLIENLPVVLRGLCDFTLSGEATALDIARTLASIIDVTENVQADRPRRH